MGQGTDPFGRAVGNIVGSGKSAYAQGEEALGHLGIRGADASALARFMTDTLGAEDHRIELWYSEDRSATWRDGGVFVMMLTARADTRWRIILFDFPEQRTDPIVRARDALIPTLRDEDWPGRAVEDGDDLFWWDDEDRTWKSDLLPR
jgi:hypothetical protein